MKKPPTSSSIPLHSRVSHADIESFSLIVAWDFCM
nr:MAG TPA: hypothetical protein [Bacteriophage sp.]